MKDKQIVKRTSFQRICSVLLRTKKQHELIRERKRFENFLKDETLIKSQDSLCASTISNEYDLKINIMCSQKEDL